MKRLSKNSEPPVPLENTRLYAVCLKIFIGLFSLLNTAVNRLHVWQKRVVFLIFSFLCAAAAMYSIYAGLTHPHTAAPKATIPNHFVSPVIPFSPAPLAGRQLHFLLDSLRRQPAGVHLLDSLYKSRPGLLDTLNMIENMNN